MVAALQEENGTYGVTDADFEAAFSPPVNLHSLVRMTLEESEHIDKFRRLYWLLLIGAVSGEDPLYWLTVLESHRWHYQKLQENLDTSVNGLTKLDPQIAHPLSNSDNNPWQLQHKNEELQNEIWKDVVRTFPENSYFEIESTQKTLLRLLYTWSKQNPDISYRQGMNELMGMFLLVCQRDCYVGDNSSGLCAQLCSGAAIEADAFTLFSHLMDLGMRAMFETSNRPRKKPQSAQLGMLPSDPAAVLGGLSKSSTPVLQLCNYIFHNLLQNSEPQVYRHLLSLNLEPQMFLLRWIRLLFSREFLLEHSLYVWDTLFADMYDAKHYNPQNYQKLKDLNIDVAKNMPFILYFSVAMIKFVRSNLLESDFGGCLRRLLKFPPVESMNMLVHLAIQARCFSHSSHNAPAAAPRHGEASPASRMNSTLATSANISPKDDFESAVGGKGGDPKGSVTADSAPSRNQDVSGAMLGVHVAKIVKFLTLTLQLRKSDPVKEELEFVKNDLSVLSKILKGDITYDARLFSIYLPDD